MFELENLIEMLRLINGERKGRETNKDAKQGMYVKVMS